jgi:hypothetical protein
MLNLRNSFLFLHADAEKISSRLKGRQADLQRSTGATSMGSEAPINPRFCFRKDANAAAPVISDKQFPL